MNAFQSALTAHSTGDKRLVHERFSFKLEQDPISYAAPSVVEKYTFAVTWKVTFHCPSSELDDAYKNALRQLRHDMYGDVENQLLKLERALYGRDHAEAVIVAHELRSMLAP